MKILSFLCIIVIASCYFEQKLIRHAKEYSWETDETLDLDDINEDCNEELLKFTHNQTYITQVCFNKDVFYNVEVILGNEPKDEKVFEMAIDLTLPYTWYKSNDCKWCKKKLDPLTFDFDDSCSASSKRSCTSDEFNRTHNSTLWDDVDLPVQIYSEDMLIQGQFQTEIIQLLAYNSSHGMSIIDYLKAKVTNDEPTEFVNITGLQMIQADTMKTDPLLLCDGALGLGFGVIESKEESIQAGSDFIENLVKQDTTLKLTKQQFAIYSLVEGGKHMPNYAIQFGGLDYKYAHKHETEVVWIDKIQNGGYYWALQVKEMIFKDLNKPIGQQETIVAKDTTAILTLSSQFLEIPKSFMIELMKKLEDMSTDTKCQILKQEQVLYCTHLKFPDHFQFFQLAFKFPTLDKIEEITLKAYNLIAANCTAHKDDKMTQDCVMNIKISKSGYFIFGEPFMRQHYMIFENQPGNKVFRVGILPAASDMYYPDNSAAAEWPLYRLVLYIFVFGILAMCFVTNCKRGCKDIVRTLRYRKVDFYCKQANTNDTDKLRVKQVDDEINQDLEDDIRTREEIELADKQKKEESWKKEQEQFNFGQKFSNIVEDHSI